MDDLKKGIRIYNLLLFLLFFFVDVFSSLDIRQLKLNAERQEKIRDEAAQEVMNRLIFILFYFFFFI
jgi:hypothetical protein